MPISFGARTLAVGFGLGAVTLFVLLGWIYDVSPPHTDQSLVVSITDGKVSVLSETGRDDWPAVTADGAVAWQVQAARQPSALDGVKLWHGTLAGGALTARDGYGVRWSPSGTRFVYSTWNNGQMTLWRDDGANLATDGLEAPIMLAPMVARAHQRVAWLDDARIVYVAQTADKRQAIRQIDAQGTISTLAAADAGSAVLDVVAAPERLAFSIRDRAGRVAVHSSDGVLSHPGPLALLGWQDAALITATWAPAAQPSTVTVAAGAHSWPPIEGAYRQTARLCPDGVWLTRLQGRRMELARVTPDAVTVMATAPLGLTFGPVACAGPHRLATLQAIREAP